MRKTIHILISILFVILGTNSAFAIEKKNINLEQNPAISNTTKNIEQAILIEKEVTTFKYNLEKLETRYLLQKDPTIQKAFTDINEIIYILRKIQTTKVHKATADNVINVVISDLKQINLGVKAHLRIIQKRIQQRIKRLEDLSIELSQKLDSIISFFIRHYSKKSNIRKEDTMVLNKLQSLKVNSTQLKNFPRVDFKNSDEAKSALLRIVGSVKKTMLEIRKQL